MKCAACNYEHIELNSNPPFRRIQINNGESIFANGYCDGVFQRTMLVNLFICPQCGTVKAEDR